MLQRGANGQHGKNQHQKPPINESECLLCVNAAGDQHHSHSDNRQQKDRCHLKGRQPHKPQQCQQRDGAMRPAKGPLGRCIHLQHIHIRGQSCNILSRPFQQKCVANSDHHIIQRAFDVLITAVQRQCVHPVAPPQAQISQTPANHTAAR